MTNEIQAQIKTIHQNALDFHIRLEIAGADLVIEDMDIDVEFVKSKAATPNKSSVTIWNLSDDIFKRLFQTTAVDVYTWYGDQEPEFTFRGYVDVKNLVKMKSVAGRINSSKGFLAPTVKQDNKGQFDIPTIIELFDSKVNYMASQVNKTYSKAVKTKQLMFDCIEAMGLGIGFIYIETYKDRCKDTYAVVLDPTNSLQPDQQSQDELIISTQLIPFLNAGDWAKLDFTEIEGVENIYEVRGKMNNYGTAGTSDIVIKLPKEPKPKKKRGRKKKKAKKAV